MDPLTFFLTLRPDQVALGAIVTYMVFALLRGWIIPRKIHLERMAEKEKQIDGLVLERENWRAAFETAERARLELVSQNSDLIDGAETTNRLMESMRNHFERTSPGVISAPPTHREIEGTG